MNSSLGIIQASNRNSVIVQRSQMTASTRRNSSDRSKTVRFNIISLTCTRKVICLSLQETECMRCLTDFDFTNILKSHLLLNECAKLDARHVFFEKRKQIRNLETEYRKSTIEPSVRPGHKVPVVNKNLRDDCMSMRSSSSSSSTSSLADSIEKPAKADQFLCRTFPKSSGTPMEGNQDCVETQNSTSNENYIEHLTDSKMSYNTNAGIMTPKEMDWKISVLDGTSTIELNMNDELGKAKKSHVCLFCGKLYNRKYGLKIHLRTHTGYKPLKCKVCSRPFSDPSNLNKHVRLHNSQSETPYRCSYCDKILIRKRDLDRHILSRHSIDHLEPKDGSQHNYDD